MEVVLPWSLRWQTEYSRNAHPNGIQNSGTKYAYYTRLMYEAGKVTPFLMYDVFKDPQDLIYKNINHRIGIGAEIPLDDTFLFKNEYHYHYYSSQPVGNNNTSGPRSQHMYRASFIFYF